MNKISLIFSLVLFALPGFSLAQTKKDENPLKVTVGSQSLKSPVLEPSHVTDIEVELTLPAGYKAYEEQFKLTVDAANDDFKIGKMVITPIKEFFDDYSKKKRRGIMDKATLKAVLEAPAKVKAEGSVVLNLTYQACTKTYCLFPKIAKFEIPYRGNLTDIKPSEVEGSTKSLLHSSFAEVSERGLLLTFIFVFLAGLLTSFTPCVFPMIPITIAVLTKDAQKRTRLQSLVLSVTYVLGIALTYSLLGVLAASTGSMFGSLLTSTWFLWVMCAIFLGMALSLFGFYELQPPAFLRDGLNNRLGNSGGTVNAFLSGIVAGVVASPCVGPVLVGILTYVAQTKNLWLGFWLLFVFALGMGMLFLVIGISTQATKLLPRSGAWMETIKQFSGVLMLGVFFYYLSFLLEQRWHDLALGLGLVILGSLGGAFTLARSKFEKIKKGLCLAFILSGGVLLAIGGLDLRPQLNSQTLSGGQKPGFNVKTLDWKPLTKEALKESAAKGRPVLIDFFADWCAACHELDELTFTNQRVQLLAAQFDLYRFDATKESPLLEEFREQFGIIGLPWVVFMDRKGKYLDKKTLTGFEEAAPFAERMTQVLKTISD